MPAGAHYRTDFLTGKTQVDENSIRRVEKNQGPGWRNIQKATPYSGKVGFGNHWKKRATITSIEISELSRFAAKAQNGSKIPSDATQEFFGGLRPGKLRYGRIVGDGGRSPQRFDTGSLFTIGSRHGWQGRKSAASALQPAEHPVRLDQDRLLP
jgi:hypothetical protein